MWNSEQNGPNLPIWEQYVSFMDRNSERNVPLLHFTKAPKAALLQFEAGRCSTCPFLKRSMSFSRH